VKIRMLTIMSGPDCHHDIGAILDLDDKEAKELIAGHFAEAVDEPGKTTHAGHGHHETTEAIPAEESSQMFDRHTKRGGKP
jgi:hypothetical protein